MAEEYLAWRMLDNPDYLGSYSLKPNEELIATIKSVTKESITGLGGRKEEEKILRFKESNLKPMVLNNTNARTIEKLYKTKNIYDWVDKKVQIYFDPTVKFGPDTVGGLRIRPFMPKQEEYFCADCGVKIDEVGGKTAKQIAESTQAKYGSPLCSNCATERFKAKKKEDVLNAE